MSYRKTGNDYFNSRQSNQMVQPNPYPYQQQQQLSCEDQIQQQEIKYAIYKDLEYVLVIIAQTKTVLDYFQNDQQNPMLRVAFNRLITQLNLSNSIHFDQYNMTRNNQSLRRELNNCKSQARLLFQQLYSDFKNIQNLRQFCDYYVNSNLADNTTSRSIPLQQVQGVQFQNQQISQNTFESIMSSVSNVETQYKNLLTGQKIQQPTAFELKGIMITKQQVALQKLSQNFPNKNLSSKANSVNNLQTSSQLSQSHLPNQFKNSYRYPNQNANQTGR